MKSSKIIELRNGNANARINPRGAELYGFTVGGVSLTEPGSQYTVHFASGATMFPWPIRVRDGAWEFEGERLQLEISEPAFNTAIHGLVRDSIFEYRQPAEHLVLLNTQIDMAPGFPFTLRLEVQYEALPDGLEVTYSVDNLGHRTAPFGIGAHPYFCVGDTPIDELELLLPASRRAIDDEQLIPTSQGDVSGTRYDFQARRPIAGWRGSVAYTGFEGGIECTLLDARGCGSVIWADDSFSWLQFFVTDEFGASADGAGGGGKTAVAIEPLTCAVNALNSGDGLIHLEPGGRWSGRWGIRAVGF